MHSEFRGLRVPGAHVWVLAALALGSLCAPTCGYAQQGGQTSSTPPLTGSVAPTGNCGVGSMYVNTTTGDLYDCNAGSWLKVNGAGGGGAFSNGLGTGYQDAAEIAAPSNPSSGNDRLYLSSSIHLVACLTSGGANCMPAGGSGTVTQVTSGNFSPLFNVSVATNTTTPAFSFAGISQTQNLFFASPNGSSGNPTFRPLAAADVPASANSCATHQFTISLASGLSVTCAQPAAADIGSIPGSSGQLLYNNAGAIGAEDPIVSYAYINLFNAIGATGAQTSSVTRDSTFGQYGTLIVTWASITGSPSGCTIQVKSADSQGNLVNNGSAVSVTPANGTSGIAFTPAGTLQTASQMQAVYACGTYPTGGTLTLDFAPAISTAVINTPSVSGSGNFTVVQPTGSNLHTVTDSGSVTNATLQASAGTDIGKLDANQSVNVVQWSGSNLGAMANYGTSPGAVLVPGVNAFITNTVPVTGTFFQTTQPVSCTAANCLFNLAQWGGTALGTPTNFGTTPGAVVAGSVNASLFLGTAASATAASGVQKVGIVGNAGTAVDAATGGAPPANVIYVGGLGSGATGGDLIGLPVGDTYKAINISTATTTLIVTGVSGRQVRISAQHMIAAAADNVAWIEGTGATCGTGTAGMAGGTTAASGYNFAANGGIAEGSGLGTVLQTVTTGDSVCLVTSAAVQLSGGIQYTIY